MLALFPAQALTNNAGLLDPQRGDQRLCSNFTRLANTNISYFVGLDTQSSVPQMLLSGDRNLTNGLPLTNKLLFLSTNPPVGWTHELHTSSGYIGLADGSVQQFEMP